MEHKFISILRKISSIDVGIILLLIAISINVYEFPTLENKRSDNNWKALYSFNTADFLTISYQNNLRIQQRYNPAVTLGMLSPESTVILPESGVYSNDELRAQLLSYGKVNQIIIKSFDAKSIMHDFDPLSHTVAEGDENYRYTPWISAIGPNSKNEFIMLEWDSKERGITDVLIDTSLLSDILPSEFQ